MTGENLILVGTALYGLFSFGILIYSLYLSWKQAKVRDQMKQLLSKMDTIIAILEHGKIKNKM